jgi:hypothetical protein
MIDDTAFSSDEVLCVEDVVDDVVPVSEVVVALVPFVVAAVVPVVVVEAFSRAESAASASVNVVFEEDCASVRTEAACVR